MPNDPRRVVDPSSKFVEGRLRVKSQRDLELEGQRGTKTQDDTERRIVIMPSRVLAFYREDIDGTTDAAMRRSTGVIGTATATRYVMGAAGRIIGGSLWSASTWTAGTATLRVRVSRGGGTETTYDLADCVIDGATVDEHVRDASAEQMIPVPNGIPFAKGDAIRLSINLVGWTPLVTDFGAELLVLLDGLS